MLHVLKPPEIALDEGVKPFSTQNLSGSMARPRRTARGLDRDQFDDSDWLFGPAGMQSRARLSLGPACVADSRSRNPGLD